MTTPLIWLTVFLGVSLAACAVASILALCKIQLMWMKAFGEQHGVNLSTESKPELEPAVTVPRKKVRVAIPIPGADLLRQMRGNGKS